MRALNGFLGARAVVASLALAACSVQGSPPPATGATGEGRATASGAAMAAFFEGRGALMAEQEGKPTYTTAMAGLMLQQAAPACAFGSMGVQQGVYVTGNILARQVQMPADVQSFCASSPSPASCLQMVDGCAAFDRSLFCDRRFVLRAVNTGHVTYNHMVFGAMLMGEEAWKALQFSGLRTNETVDLLKFARAMRGVDDPSQAEAGESLKMGFPWTLPLDWIQDVAVGFAVGHEFAHLEQRSCPGTAPTAWEGLMKAYEEFTCGMTAQSELAADLRGIALIEGLLNQLRAELNTEQALKAIDADPGHAPRPAPKNPAIMLDPRIGVRWMLTHFDLVRVLAVLNFAEIEILLDFFGDGAPEVVGREPGAGMWVLDAKVHDYYAGLARQSRVWSKQTAYHGHMISPFRYLLISELIGQPRLARFAEQANATYWAGVRLHALIDGSLDAMQERCGRSAEARTEAARNMLNAIREAADARAPGGG